MSQSLPRILQAESLFRQGQVEQAKSMLMRALQARPGDAEAANLLALILNETGEREKAAIFAERAHAANPKDWRFINNFALILTRVGKRAKAIEVLRKGLAALPTNPDLAAALAGELNVDSQFVAAAQVARDGLSHSPGHARLHSQLVSILVEMGRSEEAVAVARAGVQANPDDPLLSSQLCHAINYLPGVSREDVLAAHRAFGALLQRLYPRVPRRFMNSRDPEKRLRVAIVSGDLRTHSCLYFIEAFFELHDRSSLEIHCYHTALGDAATNRLKPLVAGWRDCAGISDSALAEAIRADAPDVAIDLSAHTCTASLLAFHSRVAPVQITYLAYPNTTGVDAMDFRIVDARTDPADSDRWCVERLLRLDPCFLCYRPASVAPPVSPPPSRADGVIRFGSFNAAAKLSPVVLRAWATILSRVPGSRLVLKASSLIDPLLRAEITQRLTSWGAPPDRLDILSPTLGLAEHLALYSKIDIALDPFPYHGTTTTCEALHMGVPVISLAGDRHASRVGVSLLNAVGLPDLVATSTEQYISLAASLASDVDRLATLRATLRAKLASSPLCDATAHTRALEAVIRRAWVESPRE